MNSLTESWSKRLDKIELPSRLRETIVEKWVNYWKQLAIDYKEVAMDSGKHIVEHPVKSMIYGGIAATAYTFYKNNPDLQDFEKQYIEHKNDLILISESCQNEVAANHIKNIERWLNQGVIRRLSLGVISFIWLDNFNSQCSLYKTTCEHLKPKYMRFNERIIDIGFWNKYWWLEEKMQDYDVNF